MKPQRKSKKEAETSAAYVAALVKSWQDIIEASNLSLMGVERDQIMKQIEKQTKLKGKID